MPSNAVLGQLFKALGAGDLREANRLARDIAEHEERRGHRSASARLRGALNGNSRISGSQTVPLDPLTALIEERPGPSPSDVVLTKEAKVAVDELLQEWRFREELSKRNISRRRKVLLYGPPGCGKTLTARSLGRSLDLPVFTVRFSSVVGAYLGQTGANLRSVFRFAESNQCILLLDEFDAVGRTRGRHDDVGELDRVVISLLQELDHTAPAGLVVAATNAPESLDRAIWRRFDVRIELPKPSRTLLETFSAERRKQMVIQDKASLPTDVKSFADVDAWLSDRHRKLTLRALIQTNG